MIFTFKDPCILVQNLKAAIRAASEDVTRINLNCIHVELDAAAGRARFVSTNGHWLWVNEIEVSEIMGVDEKGAPIKGTSTAELHILRGDAKKIIKSIETSKRARDWSVELDVDARTFRQLNTSVTFEALPSEARFPPYEQVIPDPSTLTSKKRVVVTYAVEYINEVAGAFADVVGAVKGGVGLVFETGKEELDPVAISSTLAPQALAILMPRKSDVASPALAACAAYKSRRVAKAA